MTEANQQALKIAAQIFANVKSEIAKVIVGQDYLIERLFISIIADGHILLEGVPGLAKTKTLTSLTQTIDAKMNRIQFTPDLLPSDLVGTEVYKPQTGEFSVRKGPIFTNLLLADEINRAPSKVQSALLQSMQEREVTIGEETFKLPNPFLVLATQNPIEQEGTYPLPEAQLDRFLMKVNVTYPSFDEEVNILKFNQNSPNGKVNIQKITNIAEILHIRTLLDGIFVDDKIDRYIVTLVQATRNAEAFGLKGMLDWGASPRASIALKVCAKALSLLRAKAFVTPDEIKAVAHDVLRHRILTSFEAEARGLDSDQIITVILNSVSVP